MPDQPAPDLSKSEKQRQIRVFVSSTFRDMHEERNYLVKHIFPKLRKLCEERGVTWGEVDLRWGINDEQKAEGKVLPICLEEIKRCKPYFIGLLGERYGWVPDTIPQELIDRESWLKEHIGKSGKSVTELEILHGVLNNPDMAEHAFFYFRDPAYIPDKQKDFTAEDAEGAEKAKKLKGLKERIRKSGFPVHENYPNPKALGDFIYKDLEGVVNTLYPKGSEPAPLDRDAMDHDAFAQSRAKVYFGRKAYFDRLDEHVNGDGPPLVILGESGSGKSALLANWALQYRENHRASLPHQKTTPQFPPSQGGDKGEVKLKDDLVPPSQGGEEKGDKEHTSDQKVQFQQSLRAKAKQSISEMPDDQGIASVAHPSQGGGFITSDQPNDRGEGELLIMHFIGATPYSADWMAMLRRIMGEFKRRFDIQGEIPDNPDALRLAFANWLSMAAAKGRVILILDALNQLEDRDCAPDLVWLPPVLPANIRLIVSTLPAEKRKDFTAEDAEKLKEQTRSRPLEELKRRSWHTLAIEPLNQDERKVFIEKYLAQYTKSLSPDQAERIASAGQTSNPLYLRALLEELRLFGKYEELNKKITYYLEAQNPYELYTKVIIRWEEDYEEDNDLVGESMSLIWAARRGLSEGELLDVLGKDGEPLPQAVWSPLFLAAEGSLVNRSGLLNFFHDYLRDAVRDTYIPIEDLQKETHLRLAGYFEKKRKPSLEADGLKEDENIKEMPEALLISPRIVDELTWQLAQAKAWQGLYDLLAHLPFFEAAWRANEFEVKAYWVRVETKADLRLMDAYKPVLDAPSGYNKYHVLLVSTLLRDTGYYEDACTLRNYLVEHYRDSKNLDGLQRALGNLAIIQRRLGRLDEAMKQHKEEERICRELWNEDGLSASLSNQAIILYAWGRLDEAMKLHKEAERICLELGNKDVLSASLGNQAIILYAWGRLDEAMSLQKEAESICRELGNKDGLQASLGRQANILYAWGRLNEAMSLLKEQESICRKLGDKNNLLVSLGNQAGILRGWDRLDEAMKILKDVECICRELGNKDSLQRTLGNQALILQDWGRIDEAMKLHKEEESICRELGNKNSLQRTLGNQALILKAWSRLDEAMSLLKEQERICRELGNKEGLSTSLGNQALILQDWGRLDEAMKLYKGQESLCRELGNINGFASSLANQALNLAQMNKPNEALPLVEEAYRLSTEYRLTVLAQQIKPILDKVINANR